MPVPGLNTGGLRIQRTTAPATTPTIATIAARVHQAAASAGGWGGEAPLAWEVAVVPVPGGTGLAAAMTSPNRDRRVTSAIFMPPEGGVWDRAEPNTTVDFGQHH